MKLRYMSALFIVSLVPSLVVAVTPEEKGKGYCRRSGPEGFRVEG